MILTIQILETHPDFDDDKTANLNANNLAKIGGKPAATTQPQPTSGKPGSNVPPIALNKPGEPSNLPSSAATK